MTLTADTMVGNLVIHKIIMCCVTNSFFDILPLLLDEKCLRTLNSNSLLKKWITNNNV